jgi:hypothetical protein
MDLLDFTCPIGRDLLIDPVIAEDGHYYNRQNIMRHFNNRRTARSPMTNLEIGTKCIDAIKFKTFVLNTLRSTDTLDHLIAELSIDQIEDSGLIGEPKILAAFGGDLNKMLKDRLYEKFITYVKTGHQSNALQALNRLGDYDFSTSNALIVACKAALNDVIFRLLDKGVDINLVDEDENTPLILMCWKSKVDVAFQLLSHPTVDRQHVNKLGDTALIWACCRSLEDLAKCLLEKPDIAYNQANENGSTALILATCNNMVDVALILLNKPDIDYLHANKAGDTALTHAHRNNMHGVVCRINTLIFTKSMREFVSILSQYKWLVLKRQDYKVAGYYNSSAKEVGWTVQFPTHYSVLQLKKAFQYVRTRNERRAKYPNSMRQYPGDNDLANIYVTTLNQAVRSITDQWPTHDVNIVMSDQWIELQFVLWHEAT